MNKYSLFCFIFIIPFLSSCVGVSVRQNTPSNIAVIVIDAGHGGKSPGGVLDTEIDGKRIHLVEKDIVLPIAKQLAAELTVLYPQKQILLTRTTDTFVSLKKRTRLAGKNAGAHNTLFVSIHLNASPDSRSAGFEVYYYTPPLLDPKKTYTIDDFKKNSNSRALAYKIEQSLLEQIGNSSKSRGIKQADYYVLRNSKCPAVLVECGFITNTEEALLFTDQLYVKKIVHGIMQGISDYIAPLDNNKGGSADA